MVKGDENLWAIAASTYGSMEIQFMILKPFQCRGSGREDYFTRLSNLSALRSRSNMWLRNPSLYRTEEPLQATAL